MAGVWRLLIGSAAMMAVIYSAPLDSNIQNSIETRVIVDSWAFNSWKAKVATSSTESKKVEETKAAITDYVHSVFNDLNSIFKELMSSGINLDARIVSIEFITDEVITPESPAGSGQGVSETVLNELKSWLAAKNYAQTDHTMLLTGLDLTKAGNTNNAGKAYVAEMCSKTYSLSVAEATPSGSAVMTIAHELGHSMSSNHDGNGNACSNGYIMTAVHNIGQSSPTNFRFSDCSISAIKAYLEGLHDGDSCLSAANTNTSPVLAPALGQRYTPDEICKLAIGSSSYFCRGFYGNGGDYTYDSMCGVIYCKSSDEGCTTVRASDGFVCGKDKQCSLGECKPSSVLSSVSDTCPQGDSPVANDEGQTCSQAMSAFLGKCYSSKFQRACCDSCPGASTGHTDCEYGDKATWCSGRPYPHDCYNNGETCCGSCIPLKKSNKTGCEYGDKATWCSTLNYPSGCYYGNDASCCESCPQYETGIAGCQYGDKGTWCANYIASDINNCERNSEACCKSCENYSNTVTEAPTCTDRSSSCASVVANNNAACYQSTIEGICCASCAAAASSVNTCKYGDHYRGCQNPTHCARYGTHECCGTCNNSPTGN